MRKPLAFAVSFALLAGIASAQAPKPGPESVRGQAQRPSQPARFGRPHVGAAADRGARRERTKADREALERKIFNGPRSPSPVAPARETLRATLGTVGPASPILKQGTWEESNFGAGPMRFRVVGGKPPKEGGSARLSTASDDSRWLWTADRAERYLVIGEVGPTTLVRPESTETGIAPAMDYFDAKAAIVVAPPRAPPTVLADIGPPNPNPLPVHGAGWFDIRNYGASTSSADAFAAIQATISRASAYADAGVAMSTGWSPQAVVFVPAGTYTIKSPLQFDSSFVTLKGEGTTSRIRMAGGFAYSPINIGMHLTRGSDVPNAAYRPDCFGVLDSTAASATGQRWGFRGNGDAAIRSPFSLFSHGPTTSDPTLSNILADAWYGCPRLTIDFAIKGAGGGQVQAGPIMGIGVEGDSITHGPYPFRILAGAANSFTIYVGTQQVRCGDVTTSAYTVSTGAATGLQRISFQIDCGSGVVSAFAGGVQLAVTGPALPAGCVLAENAAGDAFVVNQTGSAGDNSTHPDNSFSGICLTQSIRYTTPGVGQPQARADGGTITDRYRYFPTSGDDPNCVGYLGFTENPATAPRMLTITCGGAGVAGRLSAAWIWNNAQYLGGATSTVRIEDIEVDTDAGYGSSIVMWSVLDISYNNVTAYGAQYGIANAPHGANYYIRGRHLTLSGNDGCYFAHMSTVVLDDTTCHTNGKVAFRLVGADLRLNDAYIPGVGNPQYSALRFTDAGYGSMIRVKFLTVDTEGDTYLDCGIRIDRSGAGAALASFEDVIFGTVGNVSLFRLRQKSLEGAGPGIFSAERCFGGFSGAIVEQDGPGWIGTVKYCGGQWTSDVVNVGSAPGGVVAENSFHRAPPHYGSWPRGGSKFLTPWASDGQYKEIRVLRDGVIGSASPPLFSGRDADQSSPNALAVYATDHTAISATLNGRASAWGNLTNQGSALLAAAMVAGGVPQTPPTAWTFRLSTVSALPGGAIAEVKAAGYFAATHSNNPTNFPLNSGGSKSNAAAIGFGTFTEAATVASIVVLDQSGNAWASIQLASPLVVAPGTAVSIPIGALTFTHVPLPGNQWGGLTAYGWGRLWDWAWGAAALTPPTQFFAALSTSATTLAEPSGNGYARVACGSNWFTLGGSSPETGQNIGDISNIVALAFPNPTGGWGTITGGALADATSAGNVWALGPTTATVSPDAGTGPPSFAIGAFFATVH